MMMSVLCITSMAAESQPRVLRVAFCEAKGITEKDPDGSRHGLVMDYLNEIAKYTGWEYEYIDTTPEVMLKGFVEGKYELMAIIIFLAWKRIIPIQIIILVTASRLFLRARTMILFRAII